MLEFGFVGFSDIDHTYWQSQYLHFATQGLCKTHPTLHVSCTIVHPNLS